MGTIFRSDPNGYPARVICENSRQNGGKYKTDVVVELPKAGVLSTIINQIKSDDKLKGLFEESKFKQAF